jgi:uncharacterized membrane protein YqiK
MLHRLRTVTKRRDSDVAPSELSALEELATRTEERAARTRAHATEARDRARNEAARGDDEAEKLHVREAQAHEAAARAIEQTAALYRHRIRQLTNIEPRSGPHPFDT